jgi:hypothetical protein
MENNDPSFAEPYLIETEHCPRPIVQSPHSHSRQYRLWLEVSIVTRIAPGKAAIVRYDPLGQIQQTTLIISPLHRASYDSSPFDRPS